MSAAVIAVIGALGGVIVGFTIVQVALSRRP